MSSSTVYPYGTNGSLPASVGVINDDTTGGGDKAWSAQRGKVLREDFDDLEETIAESGLIPSTDILVLHKDKKRHRDLTAVNASAKFLFFTDIHRSWTNMSRLVTLANDWNTDGKLTAVLNGGDNIDQAANSMDSYYTNMGNCNVDILQAVGNHDYANGDDSRYVRYIAPMVTNYTGLVQPTNASTNDLCYFYKDYGDVRVISYDTVKARTSSDYLSAQNTWLDGVLDDALTNSKIVVILTHYPFLEDDAVKVNCSWKNSYAHAYHADSQLASQTIPDSVCDVVDDFIDAGGLFACWLTGHTHTMGLFTNASHPNQVMYNLGSANYEKNQNLLLLDGQADDNYDNLCYVVITSNIVKLVKIGTKEDWMFNRREILLWRFTDHTLLSCY